MTLSWLKRARERSRGQDGAGATLAGLIAELPDAARLEALTHSSWAGGRVGSYERLALLGDSVLGLAIADELYATLPDLDAGDLTKILNQAVSGEACAAVGRDLGIPGMLLEAARRHTIDLAASWMVGDRESDIEAGARAGCRTILVSNEAERTAADHRVRDLAELASLLSEVLD